MAIDRRDLDLHRLELRFAGSRLIEPRAVERLARSIEQCGQIVPCLAVAEANGAPLVLIDGYRRIGALRLLGRDTARVEQWECDPGLRRGRLWRRRWSGSWRVPAAGRSRRSKRRC